MDPIAVSWRNFRGFDKPARFEFPAITLFIGRNNVGKSSAYAPLLLLKQTQGASDPGTALLSRGPLLDIGPYSDYVSFHDTDKRISFVLDSLPPSPYIGRSNPEGQRVGSVEMTFSSADGSVAQLYRHALNDMEGDAIVTRTRQAGTSNFNVNSRLLPTANSVGRPMREVTELRRGMRSESPERFTFDGYGGLILPRSWRDNEERWQRVRDWFNAASDLVDHYRSANWSVSHFLNGISYLGPLRSLPQRTYRLAAERPEDVGREGQFAPEVLYRTRGSEVEAQTNEWLVKLGYGELDFEELGDEYFQMFVKLNEDLRVNVAHSGVGLSQLLPLLVQGLSTRRGAMLIAQQPEIHLNPAQQSLMADFLIDLAAGQRRVVVETHSEHVLLRLRRRIAEGVIDASDVAVYYFDSAKGRTLHNRIPIDENGAVDRESWPQGFFEEQLTDSFAMAIAQSRGAGNAR